MRKRFQAVFVKKPVGFMMFLIIGIIVFLWVSMNVRVPIYETVEVTCRCSQGSVLYQGKVEKFLEGEPIYVYKSREKQLIKLKDYQITQDGIHSIKEDIPWSNGTRLKLDIPIQKQSLLEVIVKEGGNI